PRSTRRPSPAFGASSPRWTDPPGLGSGKHMTLKCDPRHVACDPPSVASPAMRRCSIMLFLAAAATLVPAAQASAAGGTWLWPVTGPVIRAFDPPASPYGSGHRGIDIAAPSGTVVVAPTAGTVAFAGAVGGYLFLTIDHGG